MNVIDYALTEDLSILFDSRIILYGAGYWAERTYACLWEAGISPEVVCKTETAEEKFHGLKIESISKVLEKFDDNSYLLIVASVNYYEEMLRQCEHFQRAKICTLYGLFTSIKLHVNENILPRKFEEKVEAGIAISHEFLFPKLKMSALNRFTQAALIPEDYVWIFQPGKVGSQSIWNSIRGRSLQFHTLMSAYRVADDEKRHLDYYLQLIRKKRIKIVSGVREPISRDVAAFFQNSELELWPYHNFNCNIFLLCGNEDNPKKKMDTEEIKKRCPLWRESLNQSFEDLSHAITHYRQDVFSWFDYEIKDVFGIDVYEYPFDTERGYTIIEKDNVSILIIKMESLSTLENVIGNFIGDEEYKLINRNNASGKMYRYVYKDFKDNIQLSPDYFDFYYNGNSKFEHFYSADEIKAYYEHWKKYVREK